MAEGRIKNTELSAIAAAIRSKNGESTVYKPAEMAQAILDIPAGGSAVIESKSITANGTYTAPAGVDGYNPVTVDVQPNLQSKTTTTNGTVTPDTGYDGLSSVVVNVSGGGEISNIVAIIDNKNVTSVTGQSASITTTENFLAVTIIAFTSNTGNYCAPELSASGEVEIVVNQNYNTFYYTRPYFVLAHAFNVPSGTIFTASSTPGYASATLFIFGIK